MSDDGDDQKAPAKIHRGVQFRLPRPEAILTARGVDQGIRREIIARPKGGLVAPRLREAGQQRPAGALTFRRRDLPGVVVAVAVRQARGQVHRRRAQGGRGQVVGGHGSAIIGRTEPAVRAGIDGSDGHEYASSGRLTLIVPTAGASRSGPCRS